MIHFETHPNEALGGYLRHKWTLGCVPDPGMSTTTVPERDVDLAPVPSRRSGWT